MSASTSSQGSAPAREAVLLGAGTPWGRLVAQALARERWRLLLVDTPGAGLDGALDDVAASGGSADRLGLSFEDLPSLLASASRATDALEDPRLLVHVLPSPIVGRFALRSMVEVEREVHRGYSALVVFAHRLLPRFLRTGGGQIVALGSAAARAPLSKAAVHTAVAGALPPFLLALVREVFRQGVRIAYLEPAGFSSPPVAAEVAGGETPLHAEHRRFLVSDASVGRALLKVLHRPGTRHLRFHGHARSAPSPLVLRRYIERELHALDPEREDPTWPPSSDPSKDRRGQVAVVTGASRGIGRCIARGLGAQGMRVLLTARDAGALGKVAQEVRRRGGEARSLPLDLTRPEAPHELARFAQETWRAPDVLVNNAGIGFYRRLQRQDDAQLTSQLRLDLLALLATTRAFLPGMLERHSGHVLQVGSMAPEVPLPRLAPYSGIKGAVKGFGVALGRELLPRGLHESVQEPVTVDTDFIASASEPGRRDMRQRPFVRVALIRPEEVARLATRTLDHPRPVVFVPPRGRPMIWAYRAFRPLLEPTLRLPPPGPAPRPRPADAPPG